MVEVLTSAFLAHSASRVLPTRFKETTMLRLFLLLVLLTSSFSLAQAQPFPLPLPGMGRGTPEDERACRNDAVKFCRELLGNDMAVLQCFQGRRRQLSPSCEAVLRKYGQ
jgi:hypothetical protein